MARRDEVWERKRQAFLARQNGDAASAVSRPSGLGAVSQARYQGREGRHSSPLSRLVHEGYPDVPPPETQGTDTRQYGMQAYAQGGSRPNSQSRQPLQQQPQQQEGFHSGVAQQWCRGTSRIRAPSKSVELLHSELPWEGGVVEGPFLVKRGEMYYLFYSGECYGNHRYCVGVARAEQVLCPYTKSGAPILSSGTGWAGPGHCVVLDVGGRDVMIFHAWPSDTPGGRGPRGKGRAVLMEQEDAWPLVGAGVPCAGPQPRPLGPRGPQQPPQPPLRVNGTYRLRVAQGWDAFLGYDGRLSKATDQVFTCRVGFRPGGTVSLEGEKGRFLRHREGRLELSAPASGSFAADATWMALPGLAAGDELRVIPMSGTKMESSSATASR
eukprot:g32739.t1